MWQHVLVILLALWRNSGAVADLDLSYICNNKPSGDVVPNPFDCQSYVICGSGSFELHHCSDDLNYNAERKICDRPEKVNCNFVMQSAYALLNETTSPSTDATASNSAAPTTNDTLNSEFEGWNNLRLSFNAFNVADGKIIDPMHDYDPHRVQCMHRGAYFLPHPRSCQKYYLCAFGHLLLHNCGRGTVWSYRRAQCESFSVAECYINSASKTTTSYTFNVTPEGSTLSSWYSTASTSVASTRSTVSGRASWTAYSTMPPAPNTAPSSSSLTTSPALTKITTERLDLNCSAGSKYLADAQDCTHYFICIQGMPIGMFCPAGTYWDYRGEICTSSAKVQCLGNQ